ncbi:protein ABIL2-like isoform X2 [Tasmannia lanceolata]|uniref:protein ABIL2-like isoform X2 n=1 Tax=Tasmannia lanceolata TaxID=3420 RepID=UPI0040643B0D
METLSSSSPLSDPQEASTYDELSMHQSMLFSNSLKDLKNLRAQLYSAAEYFEVSYSNDDQKDIVVNTLKDYAVEALVNTVDHLGSVTYKVNGYIDEKVVEVSGTELRVSCIEQRLRTCQEYIDREGLSQQSLVITTPKYHKRYILPVESMNSSKRAVEKHQGFSIDDEENDWHQLRTVIQSTMRETPSSAVRKGRSQSPSPRRGTFSFKERRSVSPHPTSHQLVRSESVSSRPMTPNSSNTGRRYPSAPQKSASMRLHAEKDEQKEIDQQPSKSKRLLKALLSRRKPKQDPMLYSYLDEY